MHAQVEQRDSDLQSIYNLLSILTPILFTGEKMYAKFCYKAYVLFEQ